MGWHRGGTGHAWGPAARLSPWRGHGHPQPWGLQGCSPRVPHGLAGIAPGLHRGPWLGSAEWFDGTAAIFGVIPA